MDATASFTIRGPGKDRSFDIAFADFSELAEEVLAEDEDAIVDVGYGLILTPTSGHIYVANNVHGLIAGVTDNDSFSLAVVVHVKFLGVDVEWDHPRRGFTRAPNSGGVDLRPGESMVSVDPVPVAVEVADLQLPGRAAEENGNNNGE